MKLSHSKLSCILECPMTYFLKYKEGIEPKYKKSALAIGSAVHWGLEHETEDLSEYYKEQGSFKQRDNYDRDELLAESMVHGYLRHKDEIFQQILTDNETGEKLELLEETHEVFLSGYLPSKLENEPHEFIGIIDLLLLTNKGFILLDYKTSSQIPDWDKYLDQIYRYIFLLRENFPETPIIKIGIINIRKAGIRQKRDENELMFLNRLKLEYELNDDAYINYHEYIPSDLDEKKIKDYILNMNKMADFADVIDTTGAYYINYNAANGIYGKSDYYDIFYKTPDAYLLYTIKDTIFDEDNDLLLELRDCVPIDMEVIENDKVLNKYEQFKANAFALFTVSENFDKNKLFDYLKKNYTCDDDLLLKYWKTLQYEIKVNNSQK